MELLTEKYAELLESPKMPEIAASEKSNIALLLENQAKEMDSMMTEGTLASDVAQFTPIFMPLSRRVQPALIANELVGVQPLTSPTGYLYTLAFRHVGFGANRDDRNGGRISPIAGAQLVEVADASTFTVGATISATSNAAGNADEAKVIYVEGNIVLVDSKAFAATGSIYLADGAASAVAVVATYSNELSFRKILKGYTGSLPTNEAELLGYDMKEIGFEIKQTAINVESRKLKAEYTVEMYQDLKAMHGLNADEELMNQMAVEVQNELDREILDKVNSWCAPTTDFNVAGAGATGSGRYELEGMAHFGLKVANEAREIARFTRRGAGNVMVVSPKVATMLECLPGYAPISTDGSVNARGVGVSVIGTFNKIKVIMDVFATNDYCTIIYKGVDRRDAIGYYAPYVPISFTRVVHPESGQPAIILNSRYGIKENPLNADENIYGRTFAVNFDVKSVLS